MGVQTLISIYDRNGRQLHAYKTNKFTAATTREEIAAFISQKSENYKSPLNIEIFDEDGDWVTLDNDYLEDYEPFNPKRLNNNTAHSVESKASKVELRVRFLGKSHDTKSTGVQESVKDSEGIEQVENIETMNHRTPISAEPLSPLIDHSKYSQMGFIPGHNVNREQRSQYISDAKSTRTGVSTGRLAKIQGTKKESTEKHRSRLPRFRIWYDGIQDRRAHDLKLLVYVVQKKAQQEYDELFLHPELEFVENDNLEKHSNPYEVPIKDDGWTKELGNKLDLTVVLIKGAKIKSNRHINALCYLVNAPVNAPLCSPDDNSKAYLALVLRRNAEILWETLALSDEMIFKRKATSCVTKNVNILSSSQLASPQENQRKKRQNTSHRCSKQTKFAKRLNNSSTTISAMASDISRHGDNQNLLISFDISEPKDSLIQSHLRCPTQNSETHLDVAGPSANINTTDLDIIDVNNILHDFDDSQFKFLLDEIKCCSSNMIL